MRADPWTKLSPAEVVVARAVARGLTNRQIAEELDVSVHTVKTHVKNALQKLGVHTRAALAAKSVRHPEPNPPLE